MIAMIKRPEFEMRGNIPDAFIDVVRDFFGADVVEVVEEQADELVDITDTKWYKKRKTERNPGRNLRNYRKIHGLTQAALANMVAIHTHHISEMESGKRAISRAMALKLSEYFNISPERFI